MDLSLLAKLTSKICQPNVDKVLPCLTKENVDFLYSIDSNFDNFSEDHLIGLSVESQKAAQLGCTLLPYLRVEEVPIVLDAKEPKLILKRDHPVPTRKDEPVFEDILMMMELFSRDNILRDITAAKTRASELGKPLQLLTVDDYPCDYYDNDFMQDRSKYKGDDNENHVKDVISKVPKDSSITTIVSIWCENSKAIARYHSKLNADRIIIVYPLDFPSHNHENQVKWAKEKFPGLEVVRINVCSSKELLGYTSARFCEEYDIPTDAFFMCSYLPQFMHLRYAFRGFACIYLDEEVVSESLIGSIPDLPGDMSYRLDHYRSWMSRYYPSCIKNGRGGVYDPIKRLRVSYSIHGCWEDYIRNSSDFGSGEFVVHSISSMTGWDSKSSIKIVYGSDCPNADALLSYFEFDDFVDVTWEDYVVSGSSRCEISYTMSDNSGVNYLPMIPYHEIATDGMGILTWRGVSHIGFPPNRIVRICECDDKLFVLDIVYSRKLFSARRQLIPSHLRVPFSNYMRWSSNYVVYFDSYALVGDYGSDYLRFSRKFFKSLETKISFPELCVFGYAWNPLLNKIVRDDNCYIYASPYDFSPKFKDSTRFYEFSEQYSVRAALRFGGKGNYFEILGSKSECVVYSDELNILLSSLPYHYGSVIKYNLIDYYSEAGQVSASLYSFSDLFEHNEFVAGKPISVKDYLLGDYADCYFRCLQVPDRFSYKKVETTVQGLFAVCLDSPISRLFDEEQFAYSSFLYKE